MKKMEEGKNDNDGLHPESANETTMKMMIMAMMVINIRLFTISSSNLSYLQPFRT